MPYSLNPLLGDELQKKEKTTEIVASDGSKYDITRILSLVNSKVSIAQGSDNADKLVITDSDGNVTTLKGVVMTAEERTKLSQLTSTMILKGVKDTVEEVKAVEDPVIGWVYFVPDSSGSYLEYCYCETGWELVGTTSTDMQYHNENATTITVGGIAAGTNLDGYTTSQIFDAMFFPYVAVSGFRITTDQSALHEVGETVTVTKVTPSFSKGSKAITKFEIFSDSAQTASLGSNTTGAAISGLSFTGNAIYATLTDGKTTLSASWTASFANPYFYGVLDSSESPTSAQVIGLTKQLTTKGNKTYRFTAADQYCVLAFPSSYGSLSSILDSNGYEYISDFQKYGVDVMFSDRTIPYNVYVQQKMVIISNFAFTFKF